MPHAKALAPRPWICALTACIAAVTACIAALIAAAPAYSATVAPLSAAGFRNSIGVNTHMDYTNTAYGNWTRVVRALQQLGVSHVRDLVFNNGVAGYMQRWTSDAERAESAGIKFDFLIPAPQAGLGSVSQLVSTLVGPLRGVVESVEDPNEYDLTDRSASWATTLAAYDRQIYTDVRATPSLSRVPVIGPSLVNPSSYSALGNQSADLDYGNLHVYASGAPSTSLTDSAMTAERTVSSTKPIWMTEFGFNNAMDSTTGQPPSSDQAAAIDVLRTYLINYQAGIPRTYAYELIDESPEPSQINQEDHFGLLNNGFSPKPAFTALKNLLAVVGTPSSLVALAPLNLQLTGTTSGVQDVLLQRDATHYQLVLWRNASVWNAQTKHAITAPRVPVTVTVPGLSQASLARPFVSANSSSTPVHSGTVQLSVPPDPVVLTLTMATPPKAALSRAHRAVRRRKPARRLHHRRSSRRGHARRI
jgi:hypothetical protein